MRRVNGVPYGVEFRPHPDARVRFLDAGHILGSAIAEVRVRDGGRERRVVFSGDLGQPARPIVRDPEIVAQADVLLVESTYGNRLHKSMDETVRELVGAIDETLSRRRGNLVVPAFALGRAQELLILLYELCERGELEGLNVFVDSPLARQATAVTFAHLETLDPVVRRFAEALRRRRLPYRLRFTRTPEESMAINKIRSGALIIAASGMCEAGRVRHHLRHNLGREECGDPLHRLPGRRHARPAPRGRGAHRAPVRRDHPGARPHPHPGGAVGPRRPARAARLAAAASGARPSRTFVVHGEESAALAFAGAVGSTLGWDVSVPFRGEAVDC